MDREAIIKRLEEVQKQVGLHYKAEAVADLLADLGIINNTPHGKFCWIKDCSPHEAKQR